MTFEEFAATRMPGVLRFAAVLTGDLADAEDLAQEVLVRAYSRWGRIGGLDRPDLYVRKMILNEYLSWHRRAARPIPVGAGKLGTGERRPGPRSAVHRARGAARRAWQAVPAAAGGACAALLRGPGRCRDR